MVAVERRDRRQVALFSPASTLHKLNIFEGLLCARTQKPWGPVMSETVWLQVHIAQSTQQSVTK